jgi:hypothetical protein
MSFDPMNSINSFDAQTRSLLTFGPAGNKNRDIPRVA